MRITILNVAIEDVKTAKGGYQKADVAYKDEQGKTQGKKVMSFTNQKVFDILKNSKAGDSFEIKSEKDANNYWQWVEISPATGAAPEQPRAEQPAQTTAHPSPKSTYETAEERALRRAFEEKKQTLIIRQSSVANALEFYSVSGKKPSFDEVLQTAAKIESFITRPDLGNIMDIPNDTEGIV